MRSRSNQSDVMHAAQAAAAATAPPLAGPANCYLNYPNAPVTLPLEATFTAGCQTAQLPLHGDPECQMYQYQQSFLPHHYHQHQPSPQHHHQHPYQHPYQHQQHQQQQQHQHNPTVPAAVTQRQRNNLSARQSRQKRRHAELRIAEQFAQLSEQLYSELLQYWALLCIRDGGQPRVSAAAELHRALFYEAMCYGMREWRAARRLPMLAQLPWRGCCEDLSLWSDRRMMAYVASESLVRPSEAEFARPGPVQQRVQHLHLEQLQQPHQQQQHPLIDKQEVKWNAEEAEEVPARWQPWSTPSDGGYNGIGSL